MQAKQHYFYSLDLETGDIKIYHSEPKRLAEHAIGALKAYNLDDAKKKVKGLYHQSLI